MKKIFTHFKIILLLAIFTCTSVGINNTYAFTFPPRITVTPDTLTFSYVEGKGPSTYEKVTVEHPVNCSELEINILKENSNYEYSTDGEIFTSFPTEPVSIDSEDTSFVFYVRLKGNLPVGTYNEIHENSESTNGIKIVGHMGPSKHTKAAYVSLEGEVLPAPALTVTPESLSGFTYEYNGGPSEVKSFIVNGKNIATTLLDLGLNGENPESYYEFSYSSPDSEDGFQPIDFTQEDVNIQSEEQNFERTIYVRLKAGLAKGDYTQTINIKGTSIHDPNVTITKTVTFAGNVTEKANAIGESSNEPLRIFATNGKLFVETTVDGAPIEVYNTLGQKIASQVAIKGRNNVALTEKGLLIVRVGKRTQKVIVR